MNSSTSNCPHLPRCAEPSSSGSDSGRLPFSHLALSYQTALGCQGRPPRPLPYLSPLLASSTVSGCESRGCLRVSRGWTVVYTKPGPHALCSLLIPPAPFPLPKCSPLSLFLGLNGNAVGPVCDYYHALLPRRDTQTCPWQRLREHFAHPQEGKDAADGALLEGVS